MRAHVEIGVRLLEPIPDFERVREIVLCHHEHWNGGGYPRGLAGEEIPVPARLFAVCDAYDAMTSDRPYRLRLDAATVEHELRSGAGTQFDPAAVDAFLELVAS
jgi:HD-GYP domain-containing protein (c-di-GMP phosphodiesterase class II)